MDLKSWDDYAKWYQKANPGIKDWELQVKRLQELNSSPAFDWRYKDAVKKERLEKILPALEKLEAPRDSARENVLKDLIALSQEKDSFNYTSFKTGKVWELNPWGFLCRADKASRTWDSMPTESLREARNGLVVVECVSPEEASIRMSVFRARIKKIGRPESFKVETGPRVKKSAARKKMLLEEDQKMWDSILKMTGLPKDIQQQVDELKRSGY